MKLNFDVDDLTPVVYIAETMTLGELNKFIEKEKARGSSDINRYLVVKYRKYSLPVSAFILTIIAVSVSSIETSRRNGSEPCFGNCLSFYLYLF